MWQIQLKLTTANLTSLGKFQVTQQIQIHCGKSTLILSNSGRQIQIHHIKFKFTTANSDSLRQFQIHCGNIKFTTAISNSPRQFPIYHGKFRFATAN